jgi:hypothetical protein
MVPSSSPDRNQNQNQKPEANNPAPPIRFSLSAMLGIFTVMALFFAALRFATGTWTAVATSVMFAILALSLLWSYTSPTADRRFWTGFNIAAWIYVALVFSPQSFANVEALLTTQFLGNVQLHMPLASPESVSIEWHGTWYRGSVLERRPSQFKIHYSGYGPEWDEWVGPNRIRAGGFDEFMQTGNAMFALLIGALGGVVTKCGKWRFMTPVSVGGVLVLLLAAMVGAFVPTEIWARSVFTLTLAVLTAATIGVATSSSRGRPFWLGFMVFGWCYFLLHFGPLANGPRLLTTELILKLQEWLDPNFTAASPTAYGYTTTVSGYSTFQSGRTSDPLTSSFQVIAHSNLMLVAGIVGGLLGCVFARKGRALDAQDSTVSG